MNLKSRLVSALKKETGVRLSASEVQSLACHFNLSIPEPKKKRIAKREPINVHIRWLIRRDLAEVLDIENHSFDHPWLEEDFIRCLRQRNCIGMVAEYEERIVGYWLYELHKSKLYILNFAVHQENRLSGVGSAMIEKMKTKLSANRRKSICLKCCESNTGALMFFKSHGFIATDLIKEYYEKSGDDAVTMSFVHPEAVFDEKESGDDDYELV